MLLVKSVTFLLLASLALSQALGPAKTCSTGVAEEDPAASIDGADSARQGFEYMKQAQQNPEMMQDVMKDMQDPETMEKVQEMMQDPKFRAEVERMKAQMMQNPEMQRQMEMMKNNPAYMKEMQVHYTATLCNTVHFYCILQQPTVTRCSSM